MSTASIGANISLAFSSLEELQKTFPHHPEFRATFLPLEKAILHYNQAFNGKHDSSEEQAINGLINDRHPDTVQLWRLIALVVAPTIEDLIQQYYDKKREVRNFVDARSHQNPKSVLLTRLEENLKRIDEALENLKLSAQSLSANLKTAAGAKYDGLNAPRKKAKELQEKIGMPIANTLNDRIRDVERDLRYVDKKVGDIITSVTKIFSDVSQDPDAQMMLAEHWRDKDYKDVEPDLAEIRQNMIERRNKVLKEKLDALEAEKAGIEAEIEKIAVEPDHVIDHYHPTIPSRLSSHDQKAAEALQSSLTIISEELAHQTEIILEQEHGPRTAPPHQGRAPV